jgi:hypothetical protein
MEKVICIKNIIHESIVDLAVKFNKNKERFCYNIFIFSNLFYFIFEVCPSQFLS